MQLSVNFTTGICYYHAYAVVGAVPADELGVGNQSEWANETFLLISNPHGHPTFDWRGRWSLEDDGTLMENQRVQEIMAGHLLPPRIDLQALESPGNRFFLDRPSPFVLAGSDLDKAFTERQCVFSKTDDFTSTEHLHFFAFLQEESLTDNARAEFIKEGACAMFVDCFDTEGEDSLFQRMKSREMLSSSEREDKFEWVVMEVFSAFTCLPRSDALEENYRSMLEERIRRLASDRRRSDHIGAAAKKLIDKYS